MKWMMVFVLLGFVRVSESADFDLHRLADLLLRQGDPENPRRRGAPRSCRGARPRDNEGQTRTARSARSAIRPRISRRTRGLAGGELLRHRDGGFPVSLPAIRSGRGSGSRVHTIRLRIRSSAPSPISAVWKSRHEKRRGETKGIAKQRIPFAEVLEWMSLSDQFHRVRFEFQALEASPSRSRIHRARIRNLIRTNCF